MWVENHDASKEQVWGILLQWLCEIRRKWHVRTRAGRMSKKKILKKKKKKERKYRASMDLLLALAWYEYVMASIVCVHHFLSQLI